ncbi:hypothetical protein EIP91_011762 [Steccherinum ochraceum]|uniref:Uncharacterized protein n=1 Tax=Steccherinum ochraceum TaxID=92696 RepID=A0A4R0RHX4_9APHY|nr:hypothetical protein EIP91_011762 [Steccherinum ochraceum]
MRFSTVLATVLAVAVSSAAAAPFSTHQARGYSGNTLVTRDDYLVLRDILQAVHARELSALDARAFGASSDFVKRKQEPPPPREPTPPPPSPPREPTPPPPREPTPPPPEPEERPEDFGNIPPAGQGSGAGGSRFRENFD